MQVSKIIEYLNNRAYLNDIPIQQQLTKYINFAEMLFDIFYDIDEQFKESDEFIKIFSEQVVYLIQNNPTEDIAKMYNYLTSFNVAGAISGTVKEKIIPYIGNIVKMLLEKYGYQIITADNSSSYYTYARF